MGDRSFSDDFKDLAAPMELTKAGVLTVEKRSIAEADEKLTAGRIGVLAPGHGECAKNVFFFVKLGIDGIAGPASADPGVISFLAQRVSSLNHESINNPVKGCSIIKTLLGQLAEIINRVWSNILPEGKSQVAFICFQGSSF